MSTIQSDAKLLAHQPEHVCPKKIMANLNKYIVGQEKAKRACAVALAERARRIRVEPEELRDEIVPKNIILIGSTGVGKTEIARRLATTQKHDSCPCPWLKVEATKFTEVGYVGRDVDSIIRDLVDISVKMVREGAILQVQGVAKLAAEERVLNILLPTSRGLFQNEPNENKEEKEDTPARQSLRRKLRAGDFDDKEIEVEVNVRSSFEIMGPPGMEEMVSQLQGMMENISNRRTKSRRMPVKEALRILQEEESMRLINEEEVKAKAVVHVEQNGIVFIDEIDKIVRRGGSTGADVSREGVQRDLLPLVEGCTVFTKYGMVRTDHILFIAAGAFHVSKPSELIPEFQGRFPVRVELQALKEEDYFRILQEPKASLLEQSVALLKTEDVSLNFLEDGIRRISEIAYQLNDRLENIGARRLYTVMTHVLEMISFEASDHAGETVTIDKKYVDEQLSEIIKHEDLSDYIL